MPVQKLDFYSDGIRLSAELFTPDEPTADQPRPGIVVCHGFGGTKNFFLDSFATAFAKRGYAALTFDYRGFGESEGPKWRLIPQEQCRDIANAVTFLQTQTGVDPEWIGLYGTSAGGANVVYAASVDERVKATVATVGYGDGARWLRSLRRHWEWCEFLKRLDADRVKRVTTGESEWVAPEEIMVRDPEALKHEQELRARYPNRAFKLPLETGEAIINFQPITVVERISPRAIMFVGVENDWLIPTSETLELFERAKQPKSLLMMPAIGHHGIYYGEHITQVLSAAADFYDHHLRREEPGAAQR
jgi:pimeloyl-ACP methyl ester carboxylesterase